jgi:hypothetical protein
VYGKGYNLEGKFCILKKRVERTNLENKRMNKNCESRLDLCDSSDLTCIWRSRLKEISLILIMFKLIIQSKFDVMICLDSYENCKKYHYIKIYTYMFSNLKKIKFYHYIEFLIYISISNISIL